MTQKRKIGVLLPQSNAHPLIGKSFMRGLQLATENLPVEFIIESIGFGSDPKQLINSFQKLSYQHDTVLMTGLFGHYGFSELANYVSGHDEILIAADLGAKKAIDAPAGVFQNSLGLNNSLQSLIHYLSQNNIKHVATSTCYYESGYGFIEAMDEALQQHESIDFAGHYITPLHPRENESEIMELVIDEVKPEAIVAFHNAIYAKEHAEFLAKNKLHEKYPVFCLPFSADQELIQSFPTIFNQVRSVSSWYPELENTENEKFITDYKTSYNKTPDFFALLGYENGLIIQSALETENGLNLENIQAGQIDGPRGKINFDNAQRRTSFKDHLWSQSLNSNNEVEREIIESLDYDTNLINSENHMENAQGWYNAYLCH